MITNEQFEQAMDYIVGSCMKTAEDALMVILERAVTQEEVDEFEKYLDINECYKCEQCGWYTYPGQTCDCEETCSYCCSPLDETCLDCGKYCGNYCDCEDED